MRTTKAKFLELIAGMERPKLSTFRGSVYLRDGDNEQGRVELYRACNMKEAGICSAVNQFFRYKKWMDEAKS